MLLCSAAVSSGVKALTDFRKSIAALEALRHPKPEFFRACKSAPQNKFLKPEA
jgi:hypothetical protein